MTVRRKIQAPEIVDLKQTFVDVGNLLLWNLTARRVFGLQLPADALQHQERFSVLRVS